MKILLSVYILANLTVISDFTDCFNVCAHLSNITAQRNTAKQTQRNTGFNTRDFNCLNKTRSYFCCSPLALSCFEINIDVSEFPQLYPAVRSQIYPASANPAIVSATKGMYKNPTRPGPCRMLVRFFKIHVPYMKCN